MKGLDDVYDLLDHDTVIEVSFSFCSERYNSILECEECMVFAHSYVSARQNISPTLSDDDRACLGALTLS